MSVWRAGEGRVDSLGDGDGEGEGEGVTALTLCLALWVGEGSLMGVLVMPPPLNTARLTVGTGVVKVGEVGRSGTAGTGWRRSRPPPPAPPTGNVGTAATGSGRTFCIGDSSEAERGVSWKDPL